MDNLEKVILDYVKVEYVEDDEEIDENTSLITSGIVDSFSMVSLKSYLERKYKISIPDEHATSQAFDNVKSIANVLRKYLK
jgi:acyl carrier protein